MVSYFFCGLIFLFSVFCKAKKWPESFVNFMFSFPFRLGFVFLLNRREEFRGTAKS